MPCDLSVTNNSDLAAKKLVPLSLRHEQLHCICIFSSDGANSTVEIERKNKEEIYYIFGSPNNVSGMNFSHN